MVLALLATGVLYFFAITQRFYSVHVVDFVRNGMSKKEILADIQQSAKITLPADTAISMAVTAGGRDYTTWYGMKVDPELLIGYLRQLNYKETTYYETGPYQRLEPLTLWKKETDFAPTLTLDAWNGGTYNIIQIDQKHGLALIEVVDS
ncbi:hypothetical protein DB345_00310 [Spartobacteria bacterium LR76]|nr:hypothetical protein DB345_00310 [Spartobacteria bacterium LR76]